MAEEFQIVARLHLQGPSQAELRQMAGGIERGLAGVNTKVQVDTSGATAGLGKLSGNAAGAQAALRALRDQTAATNATLAATVSVGGKGVETLANLAQQAGLAARRFVAMAAAAGSIALITRAFREGVSSAVQFDLAMNKVAQVSAETPDKIARIRSEISTLATSLGVSSSALAETAVTLKQAGLTADETSAALKAIALTDLTPTFGGMRESTEGLIAAMRQFKLEAKDYQGTLGAMNAVAAAFAVESSDLVAAVRKAGGAFNQTGGDLNEFMGLFTSVRATTREGAEEIATGLRTVFTRLQRTQTVEALKDLNINLRYTREEALALQDVKLENQFVGAYEAVKRLSEGLEGLRTTDPRYAAVVEQLGGYRQISRVIPLLKQFEDAEKAKNVALAGGISLQVAAEQRQDTLANKLDKLREQYLATARAVVETKGFQAMADAFVKLAGGMAQVLDYAKPLVPVLTTLAAIKVAAALPSIVSSARSSFFAPVGSTLGPVRRAGGGVVPGSGDGDTVPALLTPGEFVVRKDAVRRIGVGNLRALNEGDRARVERFAMGGLVGAYKNGDVVRPLTDEQKRLMEDAYRSGLLEKAVRRYERKPQLAGLVDIEQAATDALLKAVQKFDPAKAQEGGFAGYFNTILKRSIYQESNRAGALSGGGAIDDLPVAASGLRGRGAAEPADILVAREERAAVNRAIGGELAIGSSPNPKSASGINHQDVVAHAKGLGLPTGGLTTAQLAESVADRIRARVLEQRTADAVASREAEFVGPPRPPAGNVAAPGAPEPDPRDGRLAQLNALRRDGTRVVPLSGLPGLGLPPLILDGLTREARQVAAESGKLADAMSGATGVVVRMRGGLARVIGLRDVGGRTALGPASPVGPVPDIRDSFGGAGAFPPGLDPRAVEAALRRHLAEQARFTAEAQVRDLQRQALAAADAPDRDRRAREAAYQGLALQRGDEQRRDAERARRRAVLDPFSPAALTRDRFAAQVGLGAGQRERDEGYRYEQLYGGTPTIRDRVTAARGRIAGFFGGAADRYAAVNERLGAFANRNMLGTVGTAGLVAGPLLADRLDRPGNSTAARGAGGALQGAVLGGFTGAAVGGPIGAVVGGVVGGLAGLALSLDEAARDIRQAKIHGALTAFADRLTTANAALAGGGLNNVSPGVLADLAAQYRLKRSEQTAANRDAATHTFGGFDPAEYRRLQDESARRDFGPQLPGVLQFLNKQAEELGRGAPTARAGDLVRQLERANGGVNRDFLGLVADVRKLAPADVERELEKTVRSAQRAKQVEDVTRAARQGQEVTTNAFGRLLLAVESSADGLGRLHDRAQALGDIFDGTVTAVHLTDAAKAGKFGRLDRAGAAAFDPVAAVGGEAGIALRKDAAIVDAVARELPGVLTSVAHQPGAEQDFGLAVANGLIGRLGLDPKNVPPEYRRVLNNIQANASQLADGPEGKKKFLDQAKVDVTKLGEHLNAENLAPFTEVGAKITEKLQENANRFIDGLALLTKRMDQVGEAQDAAANLGVARFKTDLQIQQTRAGRPDQALDFATLGQLEAGVRARQERLAVGGGLGAGQAEDVAAISRRLAEVTKQIPAAIDRQQEVYKTTGGKGPEAEAAMRGLAALQGQANSLTQALRNLTDVSGRAAAAQEKLNQFRRERDSRLSLVERFQTADPAELAELNRGLILARQAAAAGSLKGFIQPDRKAIVDILRLAGASTLSGFPGGPRADDLLRSLQENSFGGVLTPKQAADERDAQDRFRELNRKGEDAAKALVGVLQSSSENYFNNLQAQQQQFFAQLVNELANIHLTDLENKRARVGVDAGQAETLAEQAKLLRGIGFASGGQVKANAEAVRKYADATSFILKNQRLAGESAGVIDRGAAGLLGGVKLPEWFRPGQAAPVAPEFAGAVRGAIDSFLVDNFAQLDEDARGRVVRAVQDRYAGETYGIKESGPDGEQRRRSVFMESVKRAVEAELAGDVEGSAYVGAKRRQTEARKQLSGILGFDFQKLNGIAGDPAKLANLLKAVAAFESGKSFEGLTEKAKGLKDEFDNLKKVVEASRTALAVISQRADQAVVEAGGGRAADLLVGGFRPLVQHKAGGGSIFQPRGTDTVPAMLTPGEFVVNRQSAVANRDLLEAINQAKGPVYKADGGEVEDTFRGLAHAELLRKGFNVPRQDVGPRTIELHLGEAEAKRLRRQAERIQRESDATLADFKKSLPGPYGGSELPPAPGRAGITRPLEFDEMVRRAKEESRRVANRLGAVVDPGRAKDEKGVVVPAPRPDWLDWRDEMSGRAPSFDRADTAYPAAARRRRAGDTTTVGRRDEPTYPVGPRGKERYRDADPERDAAIRFERALAVHRGEKFGSDEAARAAAAVDTSGRRGIQNPATAYADLTPEGQRVNDAVRFERARLGRDLTADETNAVAAKVRGLEVAAQEFDVARRKGRPAPALPRRVPPAGGPVAKNVLPPDVQAQLDYEAALNPYGASALLNAPNRGGDRLAYQGKINDFNRRSYYANYRKDSTAESVAALRQKLDQEAAARDRQQRRYDRQRREQEFREKFLKPFGFAAGGAVPGHGMADTVPAVLTPGEFVLNQAAVRRAGMTNLQYLNAGGPVYRAGGGDVPAGAGGNNGEFSRSADGLSAAFAQFAQAAGGLGQTAQQMAQAFTAFAGPAQALTEALERMPRTLNGAFNHSMVVTLNGAEMMAKLTPELQSFALEAVKTEMRRVLKESLPDAGAHHYV